MLDPRLVSLQMPQTSCRSAICNNEVLLLAMYGFVSIA